MKLQTETFNSYKLNSYYCPNACEVEAERVYNF